MVPLLDSRRNALRVVKVRVFTPQRREDIAPGVVKFSGLPVHPALNVGAGLRFCGQQIVTFGLARQITADGIGLPQHEITVNQHRHHGVGVQGAGVL